MEHFWWLLLMKYISQIWFKKLFLVYSVLSIALLITWNRYFFDEKSVFGGTSSLFYPLCLEAATRGVLRKKMFLEILQN